MHNLTKNSSRKGYLLKKKKKVEEYLNSNIDSWNYQKLDGVQLSKEIEPLFIRYDKTKIEEERDLLKQNN